MHHLMLRSFPPFSGINLVGKGSSKIKIKIKKPFFHMEFYSVLINSDPRMCLSQHKGAMIKNFSMFNHFW